MNIPRRTLFVPALLITMTALNGGTEAAAAESLTSPIGDEVVATRHGPASSPSAPALQFESRKISAMHSHTCALDQAGKAFCWGVGTFGRLGTGDNEPRSIPTPVVGNHTFSDISAGLKHTCAITTEGVAYCWGDHSFGRLGNELVGAQSEPIAVDTDLRFSSISAGHDHTCAVTTDGDAYCWGHGNWAKLGNKRAGANYREEKPVQVETSIKFADISAGKDHTCALGIDGKGYCWGNGGSGRTGVGKSGRVSDVTEIRGGHSYTSLQAGTTYTCGITTDGKAYCFGVNGSAMQGHGLEEGGKPLAQNGPENPVAGEQTWASLGMSHAHTCGINTAGELFCWGNRGHGRLGIGNAGANVSEPARVLTNETFSEVTVGWTYSCATSTTGQTYCWGNGADGRLGNGAVKRQNKPVAVSPAAE